jgi:hypothetical protein
MDITTYEDYSPEEHELFKSFRTTRNYDQVFLAIMLMIMFLMWFVILYNATPKIGNPILGPGDNRLRLFESGISIPGIDPDDQNDDPYPEDSLLDTMEEFS